MHSGPCCSSGRAWKRRPRGAARDCCCGWCGGRVWLAGIVADAFGFLAQAAALGIGRLAVVQPLLVASVVFALPLGARLTWQRVRRLDIGAAALVVAALIAFLKIADPSGGRDDAPLGE